MSQPTIRQLRSTTSTLIAGVATALLVTISDGLLFDAPLGANLFLTVLAIALLITGLAWRRGRYRQGILGLAAAIVLSLPLLESPSLLAALLAILGLSVSTLTAARLLPDRLDRLPGTFLRFFLPAPIALARDVVVKKPTVQKGFGRKVALWLFAWIVPLGLGAVFVYLFTLANPIFEAVLSGLSGKIAWQFDLGRVVFWLGMAASIWALLRPKLLARRRRASAQPVVASREPIWLSETSILRSLVLFNALFAIQTGSDLTFLWGGVALPDGMTHADYAHRGAYPLIVTALLAGAFVLVSMRDGSSTHQHRMISALVYAFVAQNVLLCASAILRLDLYVVAYSLTEMRLDAGIWMALVAVGLVLIMVKIWLRRSNSWLIAANLVSLLVALWGYAIVDRAALIAQFNVEHSFEFTGHDQPADLSYLAELGPSALPALDMLIPRLEQRAYRRSVAEEVRSALRSQLAAPSTDWRSWSWRQQRLENYLAAQEIASQPSNRQNSAVSR